MGTKRTKLCIDSLKEWTFDKIDAVTLECKKIAEDELGLDHFPPQIELVTSEKMIDAHASVGMPLGYTHWSFGKQFTLVDEKYRRGQMGLAYEMVINSNPCVVYLMEDNTMVMQATVITHAAFGHNAFFKNNYLFQKTHPDGILDYLLFAKNFVARCEEKYGEGEVEKTLDSCHALMNYGIDFYGRPPELSLENEEKRQRERVRERQRQVNVLWDTIPGRKEKRAKAGPHTKIFPEEPQENLLYFIEKHAPEIVRIVRKLAEYFHPQGQTKVLNEGFACFVHYYTMCRLREKEILTQGGMLEFLENHTNIVFQPSHDETRQVIVGKDPKTGKPIIKERNIYSGINPYALGFGMIMDIKRICEEPTDEDREWFPAIAEGDWREVIQHAAYNFRDESAILQFLSPKLIRDLGLFSVLDNSKNQYFEISAVSRDDGYQHLREVLASQHDLSVRQPLIDIVHVDKKGDRTVTLRHQVLNHQPINEVDAKMVLEHFQSLWGFRVVLEIHNKGVKKKTLESSFIDEEDSLIFL